MTKLSITLFFCLLVWIQRSSAAPAITIPLLGNSSQLFFYYTQVSAGTPPLSFTVIVDTGSSDFLIPNWGCDDCPGDPTKFYNADNSTTSKRILCSDSNYKCTGCVTSSKQCQISVSFTGITEDALLTSDIVSVQGVSAAKPITAPGTFGAITNITMSKQRFRFRLGDDDYPEGIVGLAYKSLGVSGSSTFFDDLVQGASLDNVFSMCYHPDNVGGYLTLGGITPGYSNKLSYVPLVSEDFYSIQIKDLKIGGKSLNLPPPVYNTKHCITDSGTPVVTLPPKVYTAIQQMYLQNCTTSKLHGICDVPQGKTLFDGTCYSMTPAQIAAFPTISFTLDGVELQYPPTQYLKPLWTCNEANTFGLGLMSDSSGFGSVIGLSVLQPYVTVYDRKNSKLGFAPRTTCTAS